MKTLIAVLLLASPLFAYEQPGNPDRYISIGVEGFKGQEAGVLRSGNTTAGTSGGKLDIRVPIASNITLNAYGEDTGVDNNKDYTEGYKLGVGLRIYFKD